VIEYTLHFDGSCWPNPGGTAAYGFLLKREGLVVDSGHGVIGSGPLMSNNLAEFYALGTGLNAFRDQHCVGLDLTILKVYGDSDLVVKMMMRVQRTGEIKGDPSKLYFPAYEGAIQSLENIARSGVDVDFKWIPREENQECDDLSKAHNATA
jgi:ribonuclease HI